MNALDQPDVRSLPKLRAQVPVWASSSTVAGPFPDRILARSAASSPRVAFSSIADVDGDLVIQRRPRSELEVAAAPGAAGVVAIAGAGRR